MRNENEITLTMSASPHIRSNNTTQRIMLDVIIALLPALGVAAYVFGAKALLLVAICVGTCVATEALIQYWLKKPVTVNDLSAVVTGVLLGFNLPINAPWWMAVIGSVFAIALVKQVFGGLGHNFMNPALAARAFLLASWPTHMTGSAFIPLVDTVTKATPLTILHNGGDLTAIPTNLDLFLGINGVYGCIGEISALALMAGGLYLLIRKVINWRIPVVYLGTVAVFSLLFKADPVTMLCSGGLMLGAIFMATDYVTSPTGTWAQIVYAFGCGAITMVIRMVGGYPEGVSYSILLMNCVAPLLDRYIKPRVYGTSKTKKKKLTDPKAEEVTAHAE